MLRGSTISVQYEEHTIQEPLVDNRSAAPTTTRVTSGDDSPSKRVKTGRTIEMSDAARVAMEKIRAYSNNDKTFGTNASPPKPLKTLEVLLGNLNQDTSFGDVKIFLRNHLL